MANRYRGEIDAVLSGETYTLCLTLGALAELEDAFGAEDVQGLVDRFGTGRLKARDLVRIIGAGLRGGGHEMSDADVARMTVEGGAAGFARIAAALLTATFGTEEAADAPANP